jgi:hypothetical protein
MWRLFYPLRYFALINSEKRHLDLWPTLFLGAVIAIPFAFSNAVFFGQGGFIDKLLVLTSALSGFYIAALLAAATFPLPDLDKVITVGPVKLNQRGASGKVTLTHLTRREFTTIVFGYLAFNAFILSVLGAVAVPLSGADLSPITRFLGIAGAFADYALPYWRGSFVAVFALLTAHLAVVTCLGLYYLMGRLYRRDPEIVTNKKPSRDVA